MPRAGSISWLKRPGFLTILASRAARHVHASHTATVHAPCPGLFPASPTRLPHVESYGRIDQMFGKKTLRLVTAALLVGVAMGAQQVSSVTARHAQAAGESGVISITDWQFPGGCNLLSANEEAVVEGC